MNDQQRAAMQHGAEALERLISRAERAALMVSHTERQALLALREALAQPQGEWVDLTDSDKEELKQFWNSHKGKSSGLTDSDITSIVCESVIAKFKSKNTPPVVPQEPVAWRHPEFTEQVSHVKWATYCQPLYTTPPVVPQGEPD